ncbi:hypothetical protein NDU88_005907 [Pleurodeles waltl]|uniref:Uncharacterized protein n=1 Tax=Pleurodeles waltl TaxID=8319 RepID=A0AAV7TDK3_PLEWA|nr:hypothetical protein NDU88_005907 [Pleurodeles waltl]
METELSTLAADINIIREEHRKLPDWVYTTEKTLATLEPSLDKQVSITAQLCKQVELLQDRVEDAAGRARRNNVRIIGMPEGMEGAQATHFIEEWLRTVVLYSDSAMEVLHVQRLKRKLRAAGLTYALIFPAKLKILYDQRSHFFDTPEAVRPWMDHTLTDSQKIDTQVNPPLNSCGRGVSETVLRTALSLHQARVSQREALLTAAALKTQPPCLSGSSTEGSAMDSDTDGSMALFPSITPQTANYLEYPTYNCKYLGVTVFRPLLGTFHGGYPPAISTGDQMAILDVIQDYYFNVFQL